MSDPLDNTSAESSSEASIANENQKSTLKSLSDEIKKCQDHIKTLEEARFHCGPGISIIGKPVEGWSANLDSDLSGLSGGNGGTFYYVILNGTLYTQSFLTIGDPVPA